MFWLWLMSSTALVGIGIIIAQLRAVKAMLDDLVSTDPARLAALKDKLKGSASALNAVIDANQPPT